MRNRVAFFPEYRQMAGNPYWSILREGLEMHGLVVDERNTGIFGRRWLWKNRKDIRVLHFHYVQQFYAYEGTRARLRWVGRFASNLKLANLLGYQTAFTLHNLQPTYPLWPTWVDRLGQLAAVRLTNAVIVHDASAKEIVRENFKRRRDLYVIPHPHYIDVYPNSITQAEARRRLGLNAEQTVFAFVGGIRPNKGVNRLVSAFKRLRAPNLRLVIAGKPWPPPEYVENLRDTTAEDGRILLHLGFIPTEDVQVYLNAADVVVLPFRSIFTSGSTILAMSFKRPVVVPALGCLPSLVTPDVGLCYTPPDELDALDAALKQCLELDLVAMGERAYQRVAGNSARTVGALTEKAYCLRGNGVAP
jgi:glycosyltransferase involved in cell wall biosynthesis